MIRKNKLINDCYYHIYNRGIEKRKLFLDKQDYYRFIHCLYEFNDTHLAVNFGYYNLKYSKTEELTDFNNLGRNKTRDKLVEIICFSLMPNHYHLILKQKKEKGISEFMLKVGTGYAMYFNQKYERKGRLFEGPFKSILIDSDEYVVHLSRYIHLNPVGIIEPLWKEKEIKEERKIIDYLYSYRWSSLLDYIGKNNFPSVIDKDFLLGYFDNDTLAYFKFIMDWLIDDKDTPKDLFLEEEEELIEGEGIIEGNPQ